MTNRPGTQPRCLSHAQPPRPPARRLAGVRLWALLLMAVVAATGCSATRGPAGAAEQAEVEPAAYVTPSPDPMAGVPAEAPVPVPAAPVGTPNPGAGRWQPIAESPLGPRDAPGIAWTGREVVVVGGHDRVPCVPGDACGETTRISESLRDGAAYHPATDAWRPIADLPMSLRYHQAVGTTGGVIVGRPDAPLWRWTAATDRWQRLASAPRGLSELAVASNRMVAYAPTHAVIAPVDHVHDPLENRWYRLPPDPLGLSEDRQIVWAGDRLVLFATSLDPEHRGSPPVVRSAVLDDPTGADPEWTLLPDSAIPAGGPAWVDAGEVGLVAADPGRGGVLQLDPPGWSELPEAPTELAEAPPAVRVRAGADDRSVVGGSWAVDRTTGRWARLPSHPLLPTRSHASVWAGDRVILWGGGHFDGLGAWQSATTGLSWRPPWAGLDEGDGWDLSPHEVPSVIADASRPGPGGRPDGRIDCHDESRIRLTALFDDDPPGLDTPGRALRAYLQRQADHEGGEVIVLDRLHAVVLVEDREALAATARQLHSGRWVVGLLTACGDVDLIIE